MTKTNCKILVWNKWQLISHSNSVLTLKINMCMSTPWWGHCTLPSWWRQRRHSNEPSSACTTCSGHMTTDVWVQNVISSCDGRGHLYFSLIPFCSFFKSAWLFRHFFSTVKVQSFVCLRIWSVFSDTKHRISATSKWNPLLVLKYSLLEREENSVWSIFQC